MNKQSLRLKMIAKRDRMPPAKASLFSRRICSRILRMQAIKESDSIGIYLSARNEVQAERLLKPLSDNRKKVFAPVVLARNSMKFSRLKSAAETIRGFKGMREPIQRKFARKGSIKAFIVPGAAFDLNGHRLGWGGGHYDQFFSRNEGAVKIGVAYDFQIVDKIPHEMHDVKMDFIVTEKRTIKLR